MIRDCLKGFSARSDSIDTKMIASNTGCEAQVRSLRARLRNVSPARGLLIKCPVRGSNIRHAGYAGTWSGPLRRGSETFSEPLGMSEVREVTASRPDDHGCSWEALVQPHLIVVSKFSASDDEVTYAGPSHRRQTLIGEFGEFVEWPFEEVPPIAETRSCRGLQVDRTSSCAVSGSSSMCILAANICQISGNAGLRSRSAKDRTNPVKGATCKDWSTLTMPRVGYRAP